MFRFPSSPMIQAIVVLVVATTTTSTTTTTAFIPSSTKQTTCVSTSFVPTNCNSNNNNKKNDLFRYNNNNNNNYNNNVRSSTTTTTTALSMNLFDRFQRVAKSNLNNILQSLEDPEKIMTQALEDMQTDLVTVRQSYAEVTATQRRLLKQKEQTDAIAVDWYKRAQLALEKGNDALAKEALVRRQNAIDESNNVQQQIDIQNISIDKLYEGMVLLEKKILEAKSKKEQMVARARTAQTTQKVNDMLSGVTGKTSMDAFKRMEDKVEALEASAEVSKEMTSMGLLGGSSDMEREFKLLEASSTVDAELAAMKKNLLTGSTSTSATANSATASSTSSTSSSSSTGLDDELEKLKREAGL